MRKRYELQMKLHDDGAYKIKKDNGKYKMHSHNISNMFTCYWLGSCDGYQLTDKDMRNIGLSNMLDIKSSDIQDKSFYRYPDLSLPRQKVDLLKEKYNIKVTRKVDVADYKIISKRYLNKIIQTSWYTDYNKSVLYDFMKQAKANDILSDCAVNAFRLILEDTPSDAMFRINHNTWGGYSNSGHYNKADQILRDDFINTLETLINKHFDSNTKSMLVGNDTSDARKDDAEMLASFIGANNVVLDESVINIIDEGLAILENTQYDDIEKMVTCASKEDRAVALEMLANCNVHKSFDVVSGLYWWNYEWLKDTSNWNTVNVKSFRTQMRKYEGGHAESGIWSFNNYLKNLAEDGKMTKFAVDKTREKLHNTLLSSLVGPTSEVFKVTLDSLTLSDEYKTKLIDD